MLFYFVIRIQESKRIRDNRDKRLPNVFTEIFINVLKTMRKKSPYLRFRIYLLKGLEMLIKGKAIDILNNITFTSEKRKDFQKETLY